MKRHLKPHSKVPAVASLNPLGIKLEAATAIFDLLIGRKF